MPAITRGSERPSGRCAAPTGSGLFGKKILRAGGCWKGWLCGVLAVVLRGTPVAAETASLDGTADGCVRLICEGATLLELSPGIADSRWRFTSGMASPSPSNGPVRYVIKHGRDSVSGEFTVREHNGQAETVSSFCTTADITFNALALSSRLSLAALAGRTWEADGRQGVFPREFSASGIFAGEVKTLMIGYPRGRGVRLSFPQPTRITLEDSRQWGGQHFTLRIGKGAGRMSAGERYELAMTIAVPGEHVRFQLDRPLTLAEGMDWIPLQYEMDIVPGSALDLSSSGFQDGPCGSRGRIVATPDGHFVYAGDPMTRRRFYGVNLCFSAQYLVKEEVDRLLDRLVRLGYNAVRIHHYESNLSSGSSKTGFDWDPERVDRLNYLMAGCARRGLWMTTDLFVSRPVSGKQIGWEGDRVDMDLYKLLLPVHEPAYRDLEVFTRKFLDRVNPYTGRRVSEDPALAWISLVNEGPVAHQWERARQISEWKAAWNRWLGGQYVDRHSVASAVGDLSEAEDPAKQTVELPPEINGTTRRSRLAQVFLADTERVFVRRMRHLLRDELKCEALITDLNNGGPTPVPIQAARADFDYVDDHFYVDHPTFIENPWKLPSRCSNLDPIRDGNIGGGGTAITRIWGKPLAVTEFNYSAPGRYRGVGGILTGALAALQDWDALWRFAYSHNEETIVRPARMGYFDLVSDPLNQAADRAALFLFLRRDLASAQESLAVVLPKSVLRDPPARLGLAGILPFLWRARLGSAIGDDASGVPGPATAVPANIADNSQAVAALLKERGIVSFNDGQVIRTTTGEITIDQGGVLTIDTARTAGGYAEAGKVIEANAAGVRIDHVTVGCTVFVSSLDREPIRTARRLLVTHLTDLQNTGIRFGESGAQTLLDWGRLPHLVHAGSATVSLSLANPAGYAVWSLATSGRRLQRMPVHVKPGELSFEANVRGEEGARLLYEVVQSGGEGPDTGALTTGTQPESTRPRTTHSDR